MSWKVVRLRDVVEDFYDGPHATPKKTEEGPVFLGIASLTNGRLDVAQSAHLSEPDFEKWTRRVTPQAGDLVFSYETRIGEAALIPEGLRCCLGRRMGLLRPDRERVDPRFLLYAYLGPEFQDTLRARTVHGSTVDRLLLTELPDFPIRIHEDLQVQRRIGEILGALDDKIELNRKMNGTLEEIAQTLFRAWFVDFEGETDLVESEVGLIPRGWEVGTIGEDFKLTMGQSPPGSTYNEDSEGLPFYQGATDFGFRYPALRVYCTEPKRVAEEGDTLVSVRAPVGRVNRAASQCCVGRGVAALRHNSGSASYTYFVAKQLEERFERFNAEGTVFGSIGKKDFSKLKVVRPPADRVECFSELVAPMDSRIEVAFKESRTLAEIRDTLLPKLISGEIRVPEAEAVVEEAV